VSLSRYAILVLFTAAATLAAIGLVAPADGALRAAILFGALVATANTLASHGLVAWSAGRSTHAFFGAVLGGMVGRMALMLGAVVAGVLLLGLPRVPLVVSLLSYFGLFLVMELTVQHRHARRPAETR